ncbi:MAG TPA: NAD(P)/FAD-dependent oxidoreductase [Opitutaceae bacterium]|nr:NAD(P)/FAD-dependent oxidoreductase [Opitutaceae bacterium]
MTSASHYDVAIIGAGLSGLAAGIRLAHFGRRVVILERHYAPGGLNSFYSIDGRKYDVGLHAMTNFVPPAVKGTALGKLLRQLRIEREEFDLCPQRQSHVAFGPRGEHVLRFTNDPAVLEADVAAKFPREIDGFRRLAAELAALGLAVGEAPAGSARAFVRRHVADPLLEDLLFCPLMYYGSAQEHDMDVAQFAIMFRAIYVEGLSRPFDGIRRVLRVLQEKFKAAGGERRMKAGVARLVVRDGRVASLVLDSGAELTARHVLSSAGAVETEQLLTEPPAPPPEGAGAAGRLTFVETVRVLDRQPAAFGWGDDAIIFFNDAERFEYAQPAEAVDLRSGVICSPNNFDCGGRELPEGQLRITCLANYAQWTTFPEDVYRAEKQRWLGAMTASAGRFLAPVPAETLAAATVTTDMFTPRTITRFTGHLGGAVYGSPRKVRDGRTHLANLYLCGTDQGLLGIVGSMLSGITMANQHILQPEARGA